jgi:hypothetical protein
MKELNTFGFGIIVGITLVAITLQFTTSPVEIKKKMEKEAISHGAAYYEVDTNGVVTFEWNK